MTAQDTRTGASLLDLVAAAVGGKGAAYALAVLAIDPAMPAGGTQTTRAELAMALNLALFADLLERVPTASAYVAEVAARGERIVFDHGALRTIDGGTGALPRGLAAFARILEPLGYAVSGTYPLPRLRMTGKAFVQQDFPESIPQFFVSELHVAELNAEAQAAAARVNGLAASAVSSASEMIPMRRPRPRRALTMSTPGMTYRRRSSLWALPRARRS